jgi:GT2 family glycosyltransferase
MNRPGSLVATIRSVLAERPDELIIIDQSSDDATRLAVESSGNPSIRYVHSEVVGLSRAYNTAIALAANELLAFTDDDCTVPAGWLDSVRHAFKRHPDSPLIYGQVVAGSMELAPGDYIPEFRFTEERRMTPGAPFWVAGMGANFCARKSRIRAVGGFDEALGGGGKFSSSQDFDLAFRTWRAGHTVVLDPSMVVHHFGLRTSEQWPKTARAYGIGDAAFYLKHTRCHDGLALRLLLAKSARELVLPVVRLLQRRPYSAAYAAGFARGLATSFRHPIDSRSKRYASIS